MRFVFVIVCVASLLSLSCATEPKTEALNSSRNPAQEKTMPSSLTFELVKVSGEKNSFVVDSSGFIDARGQTIGFSCIYVPFFSNDQLWVSLKSSEVSGTIAMMSWSSYKDCKSEISLLKADINAGKKVSVIVSEPVKQVGTGAAFYSKLQKSVH